MIGIINYACTHSNRQTINYACTHSNRQTINYACTHSNRQTINYACTHSNRQTINYACTHSNRQTIVVELINNAGKAHSTHGVQSMPPRNFENLHCLRLILRQSVSYVKYCWLKFLVYDFANIMSPCTDRLFLQYKVQ